MTPVREHKPFLLVGESLDVAVNRVFFTVVEP